VAALPNETARGLLSRRPWFCKRKTSALRLGIMTCRAKKEVARKPSTRIYEPKGFLVERTDTDKFRHEIVGVIKPESTAATG